tara:strand:+ start:2760 stop:3200 length:441 start_codon:yes stop_codon:yes gene_type:complete
MAHLIKENNNWVIRDDWGVSDIKSVAIDINITLTDNQVYRVMENIVGNYDSSHGVNWDIITCAIDEVMGEIAEMDSLKANIMYVLTKNDLRFLKAFNDNIAVKELTEAQLNAYLNDDNDAVPSETYTALADAYGLWCDALEGATHG